MFRKCFVMVLVTSLFILTSIAGAAPPIPARIGGTVTIDGTQLTQASDTGYTFKVVRQNGTLYDPTAEDTDGLNLSNWYNIDVPIYDSNDQIGGANPGESAIIQVYKDGIQLILTSPADGQFTVGDSGSPAQIDLTAITTTDISISKTADNITPNLNDNVVFTITATNNGPNDATGIQVTDQLPTGLTYVSDDSGGLYDSTSGVWAIGTLANGASATLKITATVTQAGEIINTATRTASSPTDTNSDNDSASSTTVTVFSEMVITNKPMEPPKIDPGYSSDTFILEGGSGNYTWTVTDSSGTTSAGVNGAAYTFKAPDTENFAGEYTITVTDNVNMDSESFTIYVPLKIAPDFVAVTLLSDADSYPFTLTGAADATAYTITVDSHDDNQKFQPEYGFFVGNMATYAFDPKDYSVTTDTGAKHYSLNFDIEDYTNPDMVDIRVAPAELFERLEIDPADPTSGIKDFTPTADPDVRAMFGTNSIKLVIGTPKDNKARSVAVAQPRKFEAASGTVTTGVTWEIVGLEGSGTCVTIPVPCTEAEAREVQAGTKAVYYQNDKAGGVWKKVADNFFTVVAFNGNNSLINVEICEWSSNIVGISAASSSGGGGGSSSSTPGSSSSGDCFISALDGNGNFAWMAMIAVLAMVTAVSVVRRHKANR